MYIPFKFSRVLQTKFLINTLVRGSCVRCYFFVDSLIGFFFFNELETINELDTKNYFMQIKHFVCRTRTSQIALSVPASCARTTSIFR